MWYTCVPIYTHTHIKLFLYTQNTYTRKIIFKNLNRLRIINSLCLDKHFVIFIIKSFNFEIPKWLVRKIAVSISLFNIWHKGGPLDSRVRFCTQCIVTLHIK